MFFTLTVFWLSLAFFYLMSRRLLLFLRYFQQEEYDATRFIKWLVGNKVYDRKISLICIVSFVIELLIGPAVWFNFLVSFVFFSLAFVENDPRQSGKIRLKMTERATRIYRFALMQLSLLILLVCFLPNSALFLGYLLLIQLLPLTLISANQLLSNKENKRQQDFLTEAKRQLAQINPYVIGITGSYGKTSTKDALGNILQIALAPTFWPAKGINTPMGITREIRTRLQKGAEYAVIEMGAYGIGSIDRLCQLTPPHAAIITAVGSAHLERFGSREAIYLAKSELARAVPEDGILVCNGDNEGARQIAIDWPKKKTLLYGFNNRSFLNCWIVSHQTMDKGTHFTFDYEGQRYEGYCPLFGKTALSNVAAAFTMALALGANPEVVLSVISNLEPVDNRLQVKREASVTYLHDGYNSNPDGFAAALDLLSQLPGKRRIVMTPGMIELGSKQHEENERLGILAGQCCDLALVIGNVNQQALCSGLEKGGLKKEHIFCLATKEMAFQKLAKERQAGDLILIENDLPDLYETIPTI